MQWQHPQLCRHLQRANTRTIDNAETPDLSVDTPTGSGHIAGAVAGLGAGEVDRRIVSAEDVWRIVQSEHSELIEEARSYVDLERAEAAATLEEKAAVLATLLARGLSPPRIDRVDLDEHVL